MKILSAAVCVVALVTTVTAQQKLTLTGNSPGDNLIYATQYNSGTLSGTNWSAPFAFITSGDVLDYEGENYVDGLHIQHNFGGLGMIGSRSGLFVNLRQYGKSNNLGNRNAYYVGAVFSANASMNDNGAPGFDKPSGSLVGINVIANCERGATFFYTCNGMEVDTATGVNTAAAHKFGTLYVLSAGDAARGVYDDAAIDFVAGSSESPGWQYIFQFGKSDSAGAFSSATSETTILLGCMNGHYKCRVAAGINLDDNWQWSRNGYPFKSPGFQVSYQGNVGARTVRLSPFKTKNLPTCDDSSAGTIAYVVDAQKAQYGNEIHNGGSFKTLALCTGAKWMAH